MGNRADHASPYIFANAVAGDRWLLMTHAPGQLTDNGITLVPDPGNPLAPGLSFALQTNNAVGEVYLAVVPEPSAGLLLALGSLLLIRRKIGLIR